MFCTVFFVFHLLLLFQLLLCDTQTHTGKNCNRKRSKETRKISEMVESCGRFASRFSSLWRAIGLWLQFSKKKRKQSVFLPLKFFFRRLFALCCWYVSLMIFTFLKLFCFTLILLFFRRRCLKPHSILIQEHFKKLFDEFSLFSTARLLALNVKWILLKICGFSTVFHISKCVRGC